MKASFPDSQIDESTNQDLTRVWKIEKSVDFDESRLTFTSRSNAFGRNFETWDGDLLTGYVDSGTTQEPNYYLKSDVGGSTLARFPHLGALTIWFYDESQDDKRLDWQQSRPTLAGATHFAGRDCVVFRDARHHWIVGREDRKLYGRYSRNDWEQFDQHRRSRRRFLTHDEDL